MRHRLSVLLAVCLGLASCGGGGSSAVPATQNPASANATTAPITPAATPTPSSGLAPTSLPLKVSAYTPTSSVDQSDAHVAALALPAGAAIPPAQIGPVHVFAVHPGVTASVRARRPSTFVNSPFDVSYEGGVVVGGTASHNIYISTNYQSCASTCWGRPGQFLTDLGASQFISHLDQYVGLNSPNRYTMGNSYSATQLLLSSNPGFRNPVMGQDDILLWVWEASQIAGRGYGHVFHVFLPPNLDTCIDFSSSCYSPDNPGTFRFCAYHGSVDYGGGVHLLYTVEPFQDVPGCGVIGGPNTQNGDDLIDSTASTLSHEMFETITDPDGSSWYVYRNGQEISDLCVGYLYSANLNGTNYAVQSEYSDVDHACIN